MFSNFRKSYLVSRALSGVVGSEKTEFCENEQKSELLYLTVAAAVERVNEIGGKVLIRSEPGKVGATLPISNEVAG